MACYAPLYDRRVQAFWMIYDYWLTRATCIRRSFTHSFFLQFFSIARLNVEEKKNHVSQRTVLPF